MFIDDKASEEQAEKLLGVFSELLRGRMEALGPLIGENVGVERTPTEAREEELRHSVRIGDALDWRSTPSEPNTKRRRLARRRSSRGRVTT